MPTTIGTLATPYQICQDMYSKLGEIQGLLQKHAQTSKPEEKVRTDEKVVESVELLSSGIDKLNDAFFRKIYRDAQRISLLAKKDPRAAKDVERILKKVENLFRVLKKAHREHVRREHFFASFAHKLASLTKKLTKGVKRLEQKHDVMIKKHINALPKEIQIPVKKLMHRRRAA